MEISGGWWFLRANGKVEWVLDVASPPGKLESAFMDPSSPWSTMCQSVDQLTQTDPD